MGRNSRQNLERFGISGGSATSTDVKSSGRAASPLKVRRRQASTAKYRQAAADDAAKAAKNDTGISRYAANIAEAYPSVSVHRSPSWRGFADCCLIAVSAPAPPRHRRRPKSCIHRFHACSSPWSLRKAVKMFAGSGPPSWCRRSWHQGSSRCSLAAVLPVVGDQRAETGDGPVRMIAQTSAVVSLPGQAPKPIREERRTGLPRNPNRQPQPRGGSWPSSKQGWQP